MRGVIVYFFVGVLILNVDVGSTLKCYECTGALGENNNCEVDVKNTNTVDCGLGLTSCYTLRSKGTIKRSCLAKDACKLIDEIDGCSVCDEDVCNSGFVPSHTTALVVSIALFSLIKLLM